ncbi:MAG TPA: ankyrin repeat domain-containing protein [Gemmataceae bacterium]|nr:ankyrin repeat domain-containing protein [Gemmataceae bacterium]
MPRQLPARPHLDQLKNQAKDLLKGHKSGDPEAIHRIRESHPRFAEAPVQGIATARFTLSGAQLVIAREYGFSSWPKLKAHVDSLALETADPIGQLRTALSSDDVERVRQLFTRFPELRAMINEPVGPFDSPAISNARSREMIDVLLAAGADINAKSRWWAGGFGILHGAKPANLVAFAIQRGATVDVHAAAHLGMLDRLRELIEADPVLVHARGGDGQTPLHFAKTIEIAEYLLEHGADIDACDVDHESTPAQYMLDHRGDVARYLVERGCKTDLLLAAAVGDLECVRQHLDNDPDCIRIRVTPEFFPMTNPKAGGTIYHWTLGYNASAYQAASKFGHRAVLRLLLDRSPPDAKLLAACWLGDRAVATAVRGESPDLASRLSDADRREIAHAARNNDTRAVLLMLEVGLPVDARGQHGATPLHWAAWHGNLDMVNALLSYSPLLEDATNDFHATPLGWATHGSEHGWNRETGNYPAVVEALLQAGAKLLEKPEGSEPVKDVQRRYRGKDVVGETGH